jgi:uncharacterized protein (DUF488 family)
MSRATSWQDLTLYTIGHSTRTAEELIALLRTAEVERVIDVRTIPRSRRNPQFNEESLRSSLTAVGIGYQRIGRLGGLRRPRKDSPNSGWRNESFRGFADYMQTEDFEAGLEALRASAEEGTVALMCAEAVPWRCHRSLIADALTARGAEVRHIVGGSPAKAHRLTSFARVDGRRVTYPGEPLFAGLPALGSAQRSEV